ncbi:hypothetical protein N9B94_05020, partial [Verrucomicrobia bacterium]|nr:hypothetical protein [Verrucomicrobiota bacterium]
MATAAADVDKVTGGKKVNTLDLSNITEPLTIKIGADGKTEVAKTSAATTVLLTVLKVDNIVGGTMNDDFKFLKGASLKGWVDGHMGAKNTLDFTELATNVNLDLSDITGEMTPGGQALFKPSDRENGTIFIPAKGVARIQDVKAGTRTGFDGTDGNHITGSNGINVITGGRENDVIAGGKGADILTGGEGDDTYEYKIEDFDDHLAVDNAMQSKRDRIVEGMGTKDGDKDTLDFSKLLMTVNDKYNTVYPKLFVGLGMNGPTLELLRKPPGVNKVTQTINLFSSAVANLEIVKLGKFETTVTISNTWAKSLQILTDVVVDPVQASNAGKVHFDFSMVEHDLIFEIKDGQVFVYKADQDSKGNWRKMSGSPEFSSQNVHDLTGGKGNNIYKFIGTGSISGQLTAGAATQPVGKQNILDYSGRTGTTGVDVNLTDEAITGLLALTVTRLPGATGVLPVQEKWTFIANGSKGMLKLSKMVAVAPNNVMKLETRFADFEANIVSGKDQNDMRDQQVFKGLLAWFLGRNDFVVQKDVAIENNVTPGATTWTVQFSSSGLVPDTVYTSVKNNLHSVDYMLETKKADFADDILSLNDLPQIKDVTVETGIVTNEWTVTYEFEEGYTVRAMEDQLKIGFGATAGARMQVAGTNSYTQKITIVDLHSFVIEFGSFKVIDQPANGAVNKVVVTNPGNGYTTVPAITFT